MRVRSRFVAATAALALAVGMFPGAVPAAPPPAIPGWTSTGFLSQARSYHTATLLPDGRVLAVGGNVGTTILSSCEVFDPASGLWGTASPLPSGARRTHAAILLPGGKVLVAGGDSGGVSLRSCLIFDPATGNWAATGSLGVARTDFPLSLLPNGRILAAGGYDFAVGPLSSCEVYDPATGIWTATGSMAGARHAHAAAVLADGRVFAAGGVGVAGAEVYHPATGAWTPVPPIPFGARFNHTATLLPNGRVLVAGGNNNGSRAECATFDPVTGTWGGAPSMSTIRDDHTATLLPSGGVLVVGGARSVPGLDSIPLSSCEIFDPGTGAWSPAPPLTTGGRWAHGATKLRDGTVLVSAGYQYGPSTAACEIFDSGRPEDDCAGAWTTKAPMPTARRLSAAATLGGRVYVAGGFVGTGASPTFFSTVEAYDPASNSWSSRASLSGPRSSCALVECGGLLYALGGIRGDTDNAPQNYLATMEAYDPATGTWTSKASMATPRLGPAAACVNGRIYVFGGGNVGNLDSVEIYDPATDSWTSGTRMPTARAHGGAAVVGGLVFVIGGQQGGGSPEFRPEVEVYDPATDTWSRKADLPTPRGYFGTGVVNGEIHVAGGSRSAHFATLEIYNPATNSWRAGPDMSVRRSSVASAVHGGKLYVVGGYSDLTYPANTASVEAFDPVCAHLDMPPDIVAECQGTGGATVAFSVSVTGTPPSGSSLVVRDETASRTLLSIPAAAGDHNVSAVFPHGVTSVVGRLLSGTTVLAEDSLTVTVRDTTPPAIAGPASKTLPTDCAGSALAITAGSIDASATDACDATPTLAVSPSTLSPGTTEVTVTATDDAGNSSTRKVAVTVLRGAFAVEFLRPLEGSIDNLIRPGQTVPVKVRSSCGGVFEPGVTATLERVDRIDGSGTAIANEAVEDSGLANDGGSLFRLADGHHVYNLSTAGWTSSSGARFRVTVRVAKAGHVDAVASVVLKNR